MSQLNEARALEAFVRLKLPKDTMLERIYQEGLTLNLEVSGGTIISLCNKDLCTDSTCLSGKQEELQHRRYAGPQRSISGLETPERA